MFRVSCVYIGFRAFWVFRVSGVWGFVCVGLRAFKVAGV